MPQRLPVRDPASHSPRCIGDNPGSARIADRAVSPAKNVPSPLQRTADQACFIQERVWNVGVACRAESVGGIELGVDKVVITKLIKGGSIGEMSVIDKNPRSATVKACNNVILVAFTAFGFDMVLEDYPDIGIKILKGIARLLSLNLRKTSSRLADYMLPIS